MKICFVSNYINHHQIPFCEEMSKKEGVDFAFIQTEEIEEERLAMGWSSTVPEYVVKYYEEPERAQELIDTSDACILGGAVNAEKLIETRLRTKRLTIRYSERLYKDGKWKCISPRGLLQKYKDHTSHNRDNVCLLCAGAYTAGDFDVFGAYPGEKYVWGYFPKCEKTGVDELMAMKPERLEILWAGRFIWWKHPEIAVMVAVQLKNKKIPFHMTIIGGGEVEDKVNKLVSENNLGDCVSLVGFKKPEEVREYMKRSHIYLFTSDRREGWGAVLNEAMNSACCVVASHMLGAAPTLIKHGENGLLFKDGNIQNISDLVCNLANNPEEIERLAKEAHRTITEVWNSEFAANSLLQLIDRKLGLDYEEVNLPSGYKGIYPGAKAKSLREINAYKKLTGGKNE